MRARRATGSWRAWRFRAWSVPGGGSGQRRLGADSAPLLPTHARIDAAYRLTRMKIICATSPGSSPVGEDLMADRLPRLRLLT